MTKVVRPLHAIRLKCYDCSGWQWGEVDKCPHNKCVLYPLRYGKKPKGIEYQRMTGQEYRERLK